MRQRTVNTISSNSEPVYGLGIDTGGTYTDAVIVDLRTDGVLAKAKAGRPTMTSASA